MTTAAHDAALAGKVDASALAALLSTVQVGHAAGGRHQDGNCPLGLPALSAPGLDAAPRTPRSQPARPRSRARSTQSSRSSPPLPAAGELLTLRRGRGSRLGSLFAEQRRSQPAQRRTLAYYRKWTVRLRTGTAQDAETTSAIALRCWPTTRWRKWTHCVDYQTASAQDTQTQAAIGRAAGCTERPAGRYCLRRLTVQAPQLERDLRLGFALDDFCRTKWKNLTWSDGTEMVQAEFGVSRRGSGRPA